MINSKLTTVEIIERDNLNGEDLFAYAKRISNKENPSITVVCDNAPIESKETLLKELSALTKVQIFDKVQPNPLVDDIMMMVNNRTKSDCIIGIGGGSVLDSAKAVAMIATNGGDLNDYLGNKPSKKIESVSLPLILLPTTGGTGSEVTKVGVYTSSTGRKYTLGSLMMQARLAILNASFLLFAPPQLCASTGLDALDHALESIWNKNAKEDTIKAAQEAAIEVLMVLEKVYDSAVEIRAKRLPVQNDLVIRRQMLVAACKAGIAFSITGTAAGHSLSFVLSENWHIPHGTACAFTLPGVFALAIQNEETRKNLLPIAQAFVKDETDENVLINYLKDTIDSLMNKMKQPRNFADIGVSLTQEEIDKEFSRSFDDPKMWNQLPVAEKSNIYPILEALC